MDFNVDDVTTSFRYHGFSEFDSFHISMKLIPKNNSFILIDEKSLLTSGHLPFEKKIDSFWRIDGYLCINSLEQYLETDMVENLKSKKSVGIIEHESLGNLNFNLFIKNQNLEELKDQIKEGNKITNVTMRLSADSDNNDSFFPFINYPDSDGYHWKRENENSGKLYVEYIYFDFMNSKES